MDNENSEFAYYSNPAMFKNNPVGYILAILLIPAFGLGVVILLIWWLKTKSLALAINDNEVLIEEGLLSKDRSELRMSNIRSVKVTQSVFNRIFGTGRIRIYTAGDQPEVDAKGMPDPHRVRDLIKAHQNQA